MAKLLIVFFGAILEDRFNYKKLFIEIRDE